MPTNPALLRTVYACVAYRLQPQEPPIILPLVGKGGEDGRHSVNNVLLLYSDVPS